MKTSLLAFLAFLCVTVSAGSCPAPADSQPAAPGKTAPIATYRFDGGEAVQFLLPELSAYSYLLISGNEALLIDPVRDISVFRDYLNKHKLRLTGVFLTHSHADFVAGHTEAAKEFSVPVWISTAAKAIYPHKALKDGDTLKLGSVTLKFLETSGHTPDSMCMAVYAKGKEQLLFTGDTLFAGSVGRPDLLEGDISAADLAEQSYHSWHGKLSRFPDDLRFLPAHGAGSLCGTHLRAEHVSTIGQERRSNPYLAAESLSAYIALVLTGLPPAPGYFGYNASLNRQGPPSADWKQAHKNISPDENFVDVNQFSVIDVRSVERYAAGHVPNSLNVGLKGRFESWVGTMIPPDARAILVADTAEELDEAAQRLLSIGYIAQGMLFSDWVKSNLPVRKNALSSPKELAEAMRSGTEPVLLDVRRPEEHAVNGSPRTLNLPLETLAANTKKLKKEAPTMTSCNSSYRASMAIGILERAGFPNLSVLWGGPGPWISKPYQAEKTAEPAAKRPLPLPDRLDVQELQATMRDLPGSYELIDLRPAADFHDFTIPGAINATADQVIFEPRFRNGELPLILFDRDGTVAMAVGGILARESKRPVKVLRGGVESYWQLLKKSPATAAPDAAPAKPEAEKPRPQTINNAGC